MYLFFSFSFRYIISCTLVLWPFSESKHYIYFWYIYIYDDDDDDDDVINSPISPCVVSFISLYTCFLLLYAIFQKYRLSKSIMPWTLFLQSFSGVYARIRFYCIQQVIMSWVIYDFSHISFVCCDFVMDCQRGRLLGHMCNMLWTYVIWKWLIIW